MDCKCDIYFNVFSYPKDAHGVLETVKEQVKNSARN